MRSLRSMDTVWNLWIGDIIRCRLRDHGWRERDLLRDARKAVSRVNELDWDVAAGCNNFLFM